MEKVLKLEKELDSINRELAKIKLEADESHQAKDRLKEEMERKLKHVEGQVLFLNIQTCSLQL